MAGAALTADGRAQAGMGVAAADYDRDGWLDIAKTNFDDDTTSLYRNLGDGAFEESSAQAGLGANNQYLGWGVGFLDFDLDGWPDLLTVNGHVYPEADRAGARYAYEQRKLLYRNLGDGRFEDVSLQAGPGIALRKAARGAAFGDLFNRGRVDVVVNNMNDAPTLLHDCAPAAGQALVVKLEGTRSNRSAIGARVVVHVGRAPPHRRGPQRRQLLLAERPAPALRPGHERDGRPHRGRSGRPARATWSPASPPASVVTIREGAGLVGARRFRATRSSACS